MSSVALSETILLHEWSEKSWDLVRSTCQHVTFLQQRVAKNILITSSHSQTRHKNELSSLSSAVRCSWTLGHARSQVYALSKLMTFWSLISLNFSRKIELNRSGSVWERKIALSNESSNTISLQTIASLTETFLEFFFSNLTKNSLLTERMRTHELIFLLFTSFLFFFFASHRKHIRNIKFSRECVGSAFLLSHIATWMFILNVSFRNHKF